MIVLGCNDMSTIMGHFVSSPRERKKRDRRDSRRDERISQIFNVARQLSLIGATPEKSRLVLMDD